MLRFSQNFLSVMYKALPKLSFIFPLSKWQANLNFYGQTLYMAETGEGTGLFIYLFYITIWHLKVYLFRPSSKRCKSTDVAASIFVLFFFSLCLFFFEDLYRIYLNFRENQKSL